MSYLVKNDRYLFEADRKFDGLITEVNDYMNKSGYHYYYCVPFSNDIRNNANFTYEERMVLEKHNRSYSYGTTLIVNFNGTILRINILCDYLIKLHKNSRLLVLNFEIEFIGTDNIEFCKQYRRYFNGKHKLKYTKTEPFFEELSEINSILQKYIKPAKSK